jgi:oxygen-dependent protoporphyrinogen oxidase
MPALRVAIIGGGISGLAAAYELSNSLPSAEMTLFERTDRLGGSLWTERRDGWVIERGADSWLAAKPWATDLARELRLGDRLVTTDQATRGTFVRRGGRLHPLPEGLSGLVPTRLGPVARSSLLSAAGKARLAAEPLIATRRDDGEESIASFAKRRLGWEAYDYLVEPLLTGIFAGDGERLSLDATFPQLKAIEREHGSLLRGALSRRAGNGARAGFLAPDDGLGDLVDVLLTTLAERSIEIRRSVPVETLARDRDGYLVTGERYDEVVVATGAVAAAEILRVAHPEIATTLDAIPTVSTVTVTLGYDLSGMPKPLVGHGYVVPRAEGRPCLAMTWSSSKWRDRTPIGTAQIRLFFGRQGDQGWVDASDEEIHATARAEAADTLAIRAEPEPTVVTRWRDAIPQYELGHRARVAAIESAVQSVPGLELAGNYLRGVGIPDCVREGREAARRIAARYSPSSS